MKRTQTRGAGPPDARLRILAGWLREWTLDRALRDAVCAAGAAGPAPAARVASISYTDVPAVADIRLLHPDASPSADRPVHVALLGRAASGFWLAAPFSRFAHPASPGEWKTGRRAAALRVLCLWNVRWMPPGAVVRSWRAGRLTARERGSALRVLESWREGTPPDAHLRARTGLPVVHPGDPRRVYEDEETRMMDEAAADPDDRLQVASGPGTPPGGVYDVPDSEWQKAADPEKRE
ncbi:MAG: hypothetical protein KJ579_07270 [Verrucomicrobia bacterium]|nr:hypothetical protein [Verrucomicrobiota bacterium]